MKKLFLLAIGIVLITLSGCALMFMVPTVKGRVFNRYDIYSRGVAYAKLDFYNSEGFIEETIQAELDGSFSVDLEAKKYTLVITQDGWFFPPVNFTPIGPTFELGDLAGYQLEVAPSDLNGGTVYSFILDWNTDVFVDMDGVFTFPAGDGNGFLADESIIPSASFTNPYSDWTTGNGFGPDTETNREVIQEEWDGTTPALSASANDGIGWTDPAVTKPVGKEMTVLRSLPYFPANLLNGTDIENDTLTISAFTLTSDESNLLPDTTTHSMKYAWVGVAEYYIDAFDNDNSDISRGPDDDNNLISDADPVVYIISTNDSGTSLKATIRPHDYGTARTMSLFRINLFWGYDADHLNESTGAVDPGFEGFYYQFVPDEAAMSYSDIRSVSSGVFGSDLIPAGR